MFAFITALVKVVLVLMYVVPGTGEVLHHRETEYSKTDCEYLVHQYEFTMFDTNNYKVIYYCQEKKDDSVATAAVDGE